MLPTIKQQISTGVRKFTYDVRVYPVHVMITLALSN